jgi:uncharacterized protein YciW
MQQQNSPDSVPCRSSRFPRPFGYALLAVPAIAAVGALSLQAVAATSPTPSPGTANVAAHVTSPSPAVTTPPAAARVAGHRVARPARVPAGKQHQPASHPTSTQKALNAFFHAGYHYDDAVLLSRLWAQDMTPYDAKVRAGDKLLHHVMLPVKPGRTGDTVSRNAAMLAYADNGYGYDDAVALARLWQTPVTNGDYADVKTTAGRKLLDGLQLPIGPDGAPVVSNDQALTAYADAGYSYDDAVLLSRLWAQGITPYDAKVQAGEKLLQHVQPPIKPGATADSVSQDAALLAFFDNGYGYDDAVRLAKLWKTPVTNGDYTDVKATAGHKLLAGIQLPPMG